MLSLLVLLLPSAFGAPDWCKWVPDGSLQHVDECSGYSHTGLNQAQGCASWCEWVPAPSWDATPQCQGCQGLFHNQTNQTMINSTNFTHDMCANWCQHVSRPAWQYMPDCAGCDQDLSTARPSQARLAMTQPAALAVSTASKSATGAPDWCKWVPYGSLQYVAACSAGWGSYYHGPICASWCVWVPAPSWIYTPNCQSCSSLGSPGIITGCESWCTWVSRPAWQNTPECQRCAEEQKDEGTSRIMLP